MPQVISRNTVLLQGGGRTNIEYSAGPNINITNDVISGRDWSNEIAKGGAAAVSSHLSAGDHISIDTNDGISTISVTGDFYSAGDNINITDNVISGKDWTQDISDQIASAISGKADASAIPEIVDYSAGDNINITDHVISGKDWSYEIGQKADRSEVIERISAASESIVNNLTDTISATSSELYEIISATSGQGGGGSCPWISGGKDFGSATVQLNFGDTIPVFSSWDLSGDHNHHIWMKGAYIRLPDGSEFLPISSFSSYTASMASNMSSNWDYTNSAYSMAISNTHNKLDNSAFSAYTAAHSADDVIPYSGGNGIDVTDHVISYTGTEGQAYSAGDNINITNNVISGKDWNSEISAASSILNQMIASGDNVAYSAGNNINITDHVVSGKDWTSEINAATSGKLDTSWTAGKDVTPYSGASGIQVQNHVISITGDVGKTYSAGDNINITNDVISGKDWTNTIDEHIESAISGIEIPSAKPVSGTSGIKIEETNDAVIFSISGDVGKTYSAGANINISNQNVISGRDWSTNITSATSGKLDSSWTAGKDVTPYSAGSNINITNHVVSGKDWTSDISNAISSWSAGKDVTPYSAGANINVTNHVISGKDWSSEIAAAGSGDKTPYSGASGIQVQNHVISITGDVGKTYSAGDNINITNDVISGRDWTDTIDEHIESAISGIEVPSSKPVSGTNGIMIQETPDEVLFSITGDPSIQYSAGSNINITNHVISGRDWSNDITSNIQSAISAWSADKDVTPYSAGNNINISNHVISVTGQMGKVYTGISPINVDNVNDEISLDPPDWTLCAGPNINLSADSLTENLYISGKDWTSDITSAISAWSAGQTFGSDYTSPSGTILVDNDNGTLEASTSGLITSSYLAPSAVDFGPTRILASQMYGLHKIVDNFISGQVISSYSPWQSPEKMMILVMDNDNLIAYTGFPTVPSTYGQPWSIPYTANGSGYSLYISGKEQWLNGENDIRGQQYTAVEVTGHGVVDLYNNYSAGPGISIENHIISASGAGDPNYYIKQTPITSTTAQGDLTIYDAVGQGTPHKIWARIGSADVGLLAPTGTTLNGMLITDATGAVTWTAQSALIPQAYTGSFYKCLVCTEDDGDEALNKMPSTAQDFAYTVINGNSSGYVYYSAAGGTATLNPGEAVTMYWNKNDQYLWCTPTDRADGFDDYAYRYEDLDGLKLRQVATSGEASSTNILYIITGGN